MSPVTICVDLQSVASSAIRLAILHVSAGKIRIAAINAMFLDILQRTAQRMLTPVGTWCVCCVHSLFGGGVIEALPVVGVGATSLMAKSD